MRAVCRAREVQKWTDPETNSCSLFLSWQFLDSKYPNRCSSYFAFGPMSKNRSLHKKLDMTIPCLGSVQNQLIRDDRK
ncbi:hypothetical protein BpHYR1_033575 [Brachionus plicatilis]|uniref:Uncharacterized protein n=1 Tax=Brachionus plicatilis TaxID=10195 RepID=A0A3M7RY74_BRAPC|nr:hypothetical protein BpHYR1_033575 [Brachionus plicatilis]